MSDAELRISLQLDEANRKLDALTGKFNTAAAAGKKLADQNTKNSKTIGKNLDGLVSKVGALGAAYLGTAGAAKAFNLAATSARARDSIKIFEATGGSIEKLRKQTKGMVDDATLAKNANLARVMNINQEEFGRLANMARAAAKATGESVDFMLESIVKGTARGSKLLLDNLGILIDVRRANQKYVNQLNEENKTRKITIRDLTDEQKKRAFKLEVLENERLLTDAVALAGANSSDVYDQAEASMRNLSLTFGDVLAPAVEANVKWIKSLVEWYIKFMDLADQSPLEQRQMQIRELTAQREGMVDAVQARVYQSRTRRPGLAAAETFFNKNINSYTAADQTAIKAHFKRIRELGETTSSLDVEIKKLQELAKKLSGGGAGGGGKKSAKQAVYGVADIFAGVRTKGDKEAEFNLSFALGQDDINAAYAEEAEIRAAIAAEKAADAEAEAYAEEQANIQRTENAAMEHAQWQGYAADRRDARRAEMELERALHQERQAMNQEAQAWTMHGINTAVNLAQSGIQMMADEQDHILERLGIQALAEVGNILVAEGTRYAAKGAAFLIESGGTDPRGYAMAGLATAAIGAGIGMGGAAAFGSAHFAKMDARSADSVGANATRVRTSNSRRVSSGADGGVNLTVVYNGVGPGADEQAKAMVKIMDVARRRGFLQ
jgi:hypothetical protein